MKRAPMQTVHDLNDRIRELGKTDPDPGSVTEKLLADLTADEALLIARTALRNHVRLILVNSPKASEPRDYPQKGGRVTASAMTAKLQDFYAAELAKPVLVGDTWKFFRECTLADIQVLIDSRTRKASEIIEERDRLMKIQQAMKRSRAKTVAELPEEIGRDLLK